MWKIIVAIAILGFAGIQAQGQFCIQCTSSAINHDCVFPDRLQNFSRPCANETGLCFTRVNHDGHIQRGCGSEVDTTECTGEFCTQCALAGGATEACNIQILPVDRLTCYQCSGERNTTCGAMNGTSTDIHTVLCPIYRDGDQCVSTRRNNIIERSCASLMHNVDCDRTHNCCNGHGCNHLEWDSVRESNGADSINSILKVITIAFFGVILGYKNL